MAVMRKALTTVALAAAAVASCTAAVSAAAPARQAVQFEAAAGAVPPASVIWDCTDCTATWSSSRPA